MTRLYSLAEVKQDIEDFINDGTICVVTLPAGTTILQLYSEYYDETADESYEEQLKQYLSEANVLVPPLDIQPDFSLELNLYVSDFRLTKSLVNESPERITMRFLAKGNTHEELRPHLFKSGQSQLLISTTERRAYMAIAPRHD